MKFISRKIFLILIFIVLYIKTQTADKDPIWTIEKEKTEINIKDLRQINSYIFDQDTGAELYLINDKKQLFLKDGSYNVIINNTLNLQDLQYNLVKLDSIYYFCSSSSKKLLTIAEGKIGSINNADEIDQLNTQFSLKCFISYHVSPERKVIMVAYIGTIYIGFYGPSEGNYIYVYDFVNSREIISINNFINEKSDSEYHYIVFTLDKNESKYYIHIIKKANNHIDPTVKEKAFDYNKLNSITEISAIKFKERYAYLTSYNPNSNDFIFYVINIENVEKKEVDGERYFRFFNNYKIKYAKFIDKTTLLYYSIESILDKTNYIGVVDLQYFIVIFNIKEKPNGNLYLNAGDYYKNINEEKLFYFIENEKISYCPFIKEGNKCIYSEIFDIIKEKGEYKNYLNKTCSTEKKIAGIYCLESCPTGFQSSGNICDLCDEVLNNKLISFKTKECLDPDKCDEKYERINGICYDCDKGGDNKTIYYKEDCIASCKDIYGVPVNKTCVACSETDTYYSFKYNKCINESDCKAGGLDKNDDLKFCKECELKNLLYFRYNSSCVNHCDEYFQEINKSCEFCDDFNRNSYYDNGTCVDQCKKSDGYALYNKTFDFGNNKIYTTSYCEKCLDIENGYFIKGKFCESSCGAGFIVDNATARTCRECADENKKYYVEKLEDCASECPKGTKEFFEKICNFCPEDQYYYENGDERQCLGNCNQLIKNHTKGEEEGVFYSYKECIKCKENEKFNGYECRECSDDYYLYENKKCHKCFCGHEKFNCSKDSSKCNCLSDPNYYGYSCEFYTEKDKNGKTIRIKSLNDRLIKTSSNFFSYELINEVDSSDEFSYIWKLFLDNKEITGDEKYKNIFITSTKEKIFGINKELFENENNGNITLSLELIGKHNYSDKITFKIINSFEYESFCDKGQKSNLGLTEMKGNLILENKKVNENYEYQGKYFYQYGLLDYNNERIPLTNYIESESKNINAICAKGFYINIKNDREEIKNVTKYMHTCNPLDIKINDLLDENAPYLRTEKIFLLMSNFRFKKDIYEIKDEMISQISEFINKTIPNIINKEGYFEENSTDIKEKNITYSEPKIIFSLINNFANFIKENISENNIGIFFNLFNNIFNQVFKEDNLSSKTLSESDIKSFFRTIDNLYDICIEKNLNKNTFNKFINSLDNISKYLTYITFPSQTIELIGKRISLLSYNLGKHDISICFPYIFQNFYANTKDLSTYTYKNYHLYEKNQTCYQTKKDFFCLNEMNFLDLKKAISLNNNDTNISINFYLMPEINQKNEKKIDDEKTKYDDEDIQKIEINRNYSIVIKLFRTENGKISEIQDNNSYIKADFQFPFGMNINEEEKQEDKDKNKGILNLFNENKNYNTLGQNYNLNQDYSEFLCVPKSYYIKQKDLKGEELLKYSCFTHFDYSSKTIRCTCNFTLGDEIMVIKDASLFSEIKKKQFPKEYFKMNNKFILYIIYFFIFLLLIPTIIFLIIDIINESKFIKENNVIKDIEDERKTKYNEVKKYYNNGKLRFSFYLTFHKYPYFSVFNKYINNYPRFIRHLIICIGLFIAIIVPLVPYLFLSFSERDSFIAERGINKMDTDIKNVPSERYIYLSLAFSFIGFFFGNLFIYIFFKILSFDKEELDIWLKIKTVCKDYIYYEVKSDVLLGAAWKKIKLRMLSFYYICSNYILKKKRKKEKNNKFNEYLQHISRNNEEQLAATGTFSDIDVLLPRMTDISKDINSNKNSISQKSYEMAEKMQDEPLLRKDDEDYDLLLNNNSFSINTEKRIGNKKIGNYKKINSSKNEDLSFNRICKLDNFKLDKNSKYDNSKRTIERYEKVRNKYIYVRNKNYINEIEIDEKFIDEKDNFKISPQTNYLYLPEKSFTNIKKRNSSNISSNTITKFILISILLIIIYLLLIIFTSYLIKTILNKFDIFILKAWIRPIIVFITIISFILYYIKMLIGSILLFNFYHLRKKRCLVRFFFWIFVDKTMIQIYKVRNLITKYKKEFDYL